MDGWVSDCSVTQSLLLGCSCLVVVKRFLWKVVSFIFIVQIVENVPEKHNGVVLTWTPLIF